jgi:hypothetical protein
MALLPQSGANELSYERFTGYLRAHARLTLIGSCTTVTPLVLSRRMTDTRRALGLSSVLKTLGFVAKLR